MAGADGGGRLDGGVTVTCGVWGADGVGTATRTPVSLSSAARVACLGGVGTGVARGAASVSGDGRTYACGPAKAGCSSGACCTSCAVRNRCTACAASSGVLTASGRAGAVGTPGGPGL